MTGTVTPQDEAQLKITVRGPGGQEQEVEATIDPGWWRKPRAGRCSEQRCSTVLASSSSSWTAAP